MEPDVFSSFPIEDELGGLLSQHLSELDESLAALANKARASEQRAGWFLDREPAQTTEEGRRRPEIQRIAEVAAPAPPLPPPREVLKQPLEADPVAGHKRAKSEALLENLLRGIENQQLSITEAVSNLEKIPMPEASKASVPVPPINSEKTEMPNAPCNHRCGQCGVLGLQIRALCQSLSGLGASIVKWSSRLVEARQNEVANLVLDYVQPLKHLDARLEALSAELTSDLASKVQPLRDEASLLEQWRSEAAGATADHLDSHLSSVLRSPQFLAMNFSMDAMRPENDSPERGAASSRSVLGASSSSIPMSLERQDQPFLGLRPSYPSTSQTALPSFGQPERLFEAGKKKQWDFAGGAGG